MAIPKMKLYRLPENYASAQASDYATIADDELLPVVEKEVSLAIYEPLQCVEYRDLMAGRRAGSGITAPLAMDTEADSSGRLSEPADCTRWCQAPDAIEVRAPDSGGNERVLDPRWYRLVFDEADAIYDDPESDDEAHFLGWLADADAATRAEARAVRRRRRVRVRLGAMLWLDPAARPSTTAEATWEFGAISTVTLGYHYFTDALSASDFSAAAQTANPLTLQRGNIYDGRREGRIGGTADFTVAWKTEGGETLVGVPLKAEGNAGCLLRAYPCRQLVAQTAGISSAFAADCEISAAGQIALAHCEGWLVARTEPRRPRLFELLPALDAARPALFRELAEGVQYDMAVAAKADGQIDVTFQLSAAYYTPVSGTPLWPRELFVRYNAPEDQIACPFTPDYLAYDSEGNAALQAGLLTTPLTTASLAIRRFRLALPEPRGGIAGEGYAGSGADAADDFPRTDSASAIQIDLTEIGDWLSSLTLYADGRPIWVRGAAQAASPYAVQIAPSAGRMICTISATADGSLPNGVLVSYDEPMALARAASGGRNPAAFGWRLCAWEKVRTGTRFVGSHRNWVRDHLNNNPDIFWGYREYDGLTAEGRPDDSNFQIAYVEQGEYDIDYREGAVEFAEARTTYDYDDVRNFPADLGLTSFDGKPEAKELRQYLRLAAAKHAYYDGIRDIAGGLLREYAVADGQHLYRMLEDPVYGTLEDRQWLVRNDDAMPQAFAWRNAYIPTPEYATAAEAERWRATDLAAGDLLMLSFAGARSIAIADLLAAPETTGLPLGTEETVIARLAYSPAWTGGTATIEEAELPAGAAIFTVAALWRYAADGWEHVATTVRNAAAPETAIDFARAAVDDPAATIAANIAARRAAALLYTPPGGDAPYTLRLVTGESCLIAEALPRS